MKELKIAVIGFYYGKFPDWIQYWLKSCSTNPTIDFFIVTDLKLINKPNNVHIINLSFKETKDLFENKLNMTISLDKPYKLCDYKPLYGLFLEDYIKDYDYWGHCDFDLIWGDIREYINKYNLSYYDKFLPLGHLSLYKNTTEVNNFFKLDGSLCGDYNNVFTSDRSFAFDEIDGIYSIYNKNNLSMFKYRVFADLNKDHKRFKLKFGDKNYKYQAFYYEYGKTYRAFIKDNKVFSEEYMYIHFRRKLKVENNIDWENIDSFFISPLGIIPKVKPGLPSVDEILKYNENPGSFYELLETIHFYIHSINLIKPRLKSEIIALKYSKYKV